MFFFVLDHPVPQHSVNCGSSLDFSILQAIDSARSKGWQWEARKGMVFMEGSKIEKKRKQTMSLKTAHQHPYTKKRPTPKGRGGRGGCLDTHEPTQNFLNTHPPTHPSTPSRWEAYKAMSFLRCINRDMLTSARAMGHGSGKSNSGHAWEGVGWCGVSQKEGHEREDGESIGIKCNSAHRLGGGGLIIYNGSFTHLGGHYTT